MAVIIDEKSLKNIAMQASFIAEEYEANKVTGNETRAENKSCYLQGMAYVLEKFGYIFQYKDNTHIFIDSIENVVANNSLKSLNKD